MTEQPFAQHGFGILPADAAVGDGDAVMKLAAVAGERLASGLDVALEHHAHDGTVPGHPLGQHVPPHDRLPPVILARVGMAAVDDHAGGQSGGLELRAGLVKGLRRVV